MRYIRRLTKHIDTKKYPHLKDVSDYYVTEDYTVMITKLITPTGCPLIHIRVRRIDGKPIHSYADLLQIKNDMLGEEASAAEVYPSMSKLVDNSNTYHLWAGGDMCLPDLNQYYEYNKE